MRLEKHLERRGAPGLFLSLRSQESNAVSQTPTDIAAQRTGDSSINSDARRHERGHLARAVRSTPRPASGAPTAASSAPAPPKGAASTDGAPVAKQTVPRRAGVIASRPSTGPLGCILLGGGSHNGTQPNEMQSAVGGGAWFQAPLWPGAAPRAEAESGRRRSSEGGG